MTDARSIDGAVRPRPAGKKGQEEDIPDGSGRHLVDRLDHDSVHDAFRDVEHREDSGAHDEDRRIREMRTRARPTASHSSASHAGVLRQTCS